MIPYDCVLDFERSGLMIPLVNGPSEKAVVFAITDCDFFAQDDVGRCYGFLVVARFARITTKTLIQRLFRTLIVLTQIIISLLNQSCTLIF